MRELSAPVLVREHPLPGLLGVRKLTARPVDVLALSAPAVLLLAAAVLGRHAGWLPSVAWWIATLAFGLLVLYLRERIDHPLMRIIGVFWVAPAVLVLYGTLNPLIDVISPAMVDAYFLRSDLELFGVHPTLWLESRVAPGMVDLLLVSYASYYFWPLTLAGILYMRGRQHDVDRLSLLLLTTFALNYLFYIFVPVIGPRWTLAEAYAGPLEGWLVGTALWGYFLHVPMIRDCFPSGHTDITLLVMAFAFVRMRRFFWVMLPFGLFQIAATVVARFHYVLDLVFAVPFAMAAWWLMEAADDNLPKEVRLVDRIEETSSGSRSEPSARRA